MLFGRILGWLLILCAFLVVAMEAYAWLDQGTYHIMATGELWYRESPNSLNLVQAVVQRYIAAFLWDYGIRPVLLMPAWLVLGVLGILFLLIFRSRTRRRRHHSSFG
ncbi:MAG TPA: hypothetical protein VEJ16_03300 [Alphaproteobacteria bacterium]|nr:hypothetical protein [Alphaproteobacteria bacterium]